MYQVLLLTGYCCKNKFIHESKFDSNSWIANLGNHNECNNSYLSVIIQNGMPIGSQKRVKLIHVTPLNIYLSTYCHSSYALFIDLWDPEGQLIGHGKTIILW